jgi:hypothetical protein
VRRPGGLGDAGSRPVADRRARGGSGSILLEVLVGVILIGLVVGPLAVALSGLVGQARTTRTGDDAAVQRRIAAGGEGEWGPRVIDGWWRPGPVLHLKTCIETGGRGAAVVGVWVDGWMVGMARLESVGGGSTAAADTVLDGGIWAERGGCEVVVRVGSEEGPWGPPWRSAVPDEAALDPAQGAPLPEGTSVPTVVVHRPAVGTSALGVSWSAGGLVAPPFGLVFEESVPVSGWAEVKLDGRSQWWRVEEDRSVDLYY